MLFTSTRRIYFSVSWKEKVDHDENLKCLFVVVIFAQLLLFFCLCYPVPLDLNDNLQCKTTHFICFI